MKPPLVYVLVINWNGLEHLRECFDTLLASSYTNARFVLIDNASTDGSVEFVRDTYGGDSRVDILECATNLGWAGGNNAGMEKAIAAGAEFVFLLNNDTATAPDAIERLVDAAARRPNAGALAPKMLLYDHPDLLNSVGLECSRVGSSWDLGIGRLDAPRWNEERQVIGVCGGAAFFRVEALRRTGLLPTDFTIYLDDLDLCLRIWDAGYEVWNCPGSTVRHKYSATMGEGKQLRRKYYLNTRNRLRVILRNFPAAKLLWVLPLYKLGELRAIGRALLDRAPWRAGAHIRSVWAGLGYLPAALRERRRRGRGPCAFWPLIRTDRMFFQGVEFPTDGWYAERVVAGRRVRPISARARRVVEAGRLRVVLANCYPRLGSASVEVRQNGVVMASLDTSGADETILEVASGTLEFVAGRIFKAEDTGETFDIGCWLALERA